MNKSTPLGITHKNTPHNKNTSNNWTYYSRLVADKMEKKEIIDFYLENNILISPDLLEELDNLAFPIAQETNLLVLNKDIINKNLNVNWLDFEKARVFLEKKKNPKLYNSFLEFINKTKEPETPRDENKITITSSYSEISGKRTVPHFVSLFNHRFKEIEKILRLRNELQGAISISRLNSRNGRENVAIIGIIYEKHVSKNENIILTIEDPTGFIKATVSKNKKETFDLIKDSNLDEVIGLTGTFDRNIIFANNIYLPDVPATKELKKAPKEEYLMILGDLHVGNKFFLEKEFKKFLYWIQGKIGSEKHKAIAEKVKYIVLTGDLVEGVGIYPSQEEDLAVKDIYEQYKVLAEFLKQIPENIKIIAFPGNHDAGRISEPQPYLSKEYAEALWNLKNVILVSNPSYVNIASTEDFPGFDLLLYHGSSFPYYANNVESIRSKGGIKRADLIMKYLLQRRHLAPTHTSTLYIPDPKKDPLLIDKLPDIFITGHTHSVSATTYKNITLINSSCWLSQTDYQERRGIVPIFARIPLINLKTREIKIMNFASKEADEEEEAEEIETNT